MSGRDPFDHPQRPLAPSHENDLKLAEIIGACMAHMTPEGLHVALLEAEARHRSDRRHNRRCQLCHGGRSE